MVFPVAKTVPVLKVLQSAFVVVGNRTLCELENNEVEGCEGKFQTQQRKQTHTSFATGSSAGICVTLGGKLVAEVKAEDEFG